MWPVQITPPQPGVVLIGATEREFTSWGRCGVLETERRRKYQHAVCARCCVQIACCAKSKREWHWIQGRGEGGRQVGRSGCPQGAICHALTPCPQPASLNSKPRINELRFWTRGSDVGCCWDKQPAPGWAPPEESPHPARQMPAGSVSGARRACCGTASSAPSSAASSADSSASRCQLSRRGRRSLRRTPPRQSERPPPRSRRPCPASPPACSCTRPDRRAQHQHPDPSP